MRKIRFILVAMLFCILAKPISVTSDTNSPVVLVLNSYQSHFITDSSVIPVIESTLRASFGNVEIYFEYMDTKRFLNDEYFAKLADLYSYKYGDMDIDIVISLDDNALHFLKHYCSVLFGSAPVVSYGINDKSIMEDLDEAHFVALPEEIEIAPNIELARNLHPGLKNIFVTSDGTPTGLGLRQLVIDTEPDFPALTFHYLNGEDITTAELGERVRAIPDDSIILHLVWMSDHEEAFIEPGVSVRTINSVSPVPVYAPAFSRPQDGVLGGIMFFSAGQGRQVAEIAVEILHGKSPENIHVEPGKGNRFIFDYKQLIRWDIAESSLPEGSVIINKPVTFFSQNKTTIQIAAAVILVLCLFIIVLLVYISVKHRLENKLSESEERYRLLFETSRDSFNINTPDGRIIHVNQAYLDLFGYTKADIQDLHATDTYVNPDDRSLILAKLFADNYLKDYPVKLKAKDGIPIDALVTASLSTDSDGDPKYLYVNTHDVSDRKRLESQLLQAQKMESVGRLAGGVAHDFNNILTAIIGYSDFALTSMSEDDPAYQDILEIKANSDRAAELTRQLLAFSRRQIAEPKPLSLNAALVNMDRMLHRIIGESIRFDTVFEDNLWNVYIDPVQIEQVLINLVVNASDAIRHDGSITVETANVTFEKDAVHSNFEIIPGDYVMLAVSDDGIGMDEDTKSKIFEPFFTTKEVGQGTGLGLATCYGIIKQNKGYIWVYSEHGKGSTFKVYLPKCSRDTVEKSSGDDYTATHGGTETILVVEDEDAVRKMIIRTLSSRGFYVHSASNGVDALKLIDENDIKPDLMITDAVMPEMGGPELYKEMSHRQPSLKSIFISGYTGNVLSMRGVDAREVEILQKPFTQDQLLDKVHAMINQDIP